MLKDLTPFCERMERGYLHEYLEAKAISIQIGKKYRLFSKELLQEIITSQMVCGNDNLTALLFEYDEDLRPLAKSILNAALLNKGEEIQEENYFRLISSFVHMHVNRAMPLDARENEVILCGLLARTFAAQFELLEGARQNGHHGLVFS
jgi:hypothetical protein